MYVDVENVVKSYGEGAARATVLNGVTLSIAEGEICVMLGPSGSGSAKRSKRWLASCGPAAASGWYELSTDDYNLTDDAAICIGGAIRDPLSGRGYVYQAMRVTGAADPRDDRSEERRVGKECRSRWSPYH